MKLISNNNTFAVQSLLQRYRMLLCKDVKKLSFRFIYIANI